MSRASRIRVIKDIEKKRGSKVIAYVTSDREGLAVPIASDIISIIHNHILSLGKADDMKLDLFIYSRGGHSDVPWAIVSMFREYAKSGSFSVLIPYRAHSAATVISLGADEIIMTKKAELGPIDITIEGGPYNPCEKNSNQRLPISVEDVTGYFSLLDKVGCARPEEKMKGFELLTSNVHPLALGEVSRLLEETKLVGLRLLSTRAKPFSDTENQEIIRGLSSEVFSHGHAINRTEALNNLLLKQVKNAEDYNIADELWTLYEEYRNLFKLEEPYHPEEYLISNDLENHTWNKLNLACVESAKRFDICTTDMRVVRLRKIPPQVNLNVSNVNFPTINIPNIPASITLEQVQALIQQVAGQVIQQSINATVGSVVEQLIKSLPQAGFERIQFNSGWRKSR
jgi:Serine dehydrogenase proteinase